MTSANRLHARLRAPVGRLVLDVELDTDGGALALIGPNGAGKSSLLSMLLGAVPVHEGRITLGDTVLLDTEGRVNVPLEERRLGYVPQDYALFPHLSVRENVAFAVVSAARDGSRRELARRVDELLEQLGLSAIGERSPQVLSGGEKQRAALARALAARPRALLLDEPLAALDVHARIEMRELLGAWLKKLELPAVVVTHDAADARALGQRIIVLEAGAVTQVGTWDQLVAAPRSPFVAQMVASG